MPALTVAYTGDEVRTFGRSLGSALVYTCRRAARSILSETVSDSRDRWRNILRSVIDWPLSEGAGRHRGLTLLVVGLVPRVPNMDVIALSLTAP